MMKICILILVVCVLCRNTEKTAQTEKNFKISRPQKHSHRKRYTAPILLYSNHVATFQLKLFGDVETNPGPVSCSLCEKTVRKDSSTVLCNQQRLNTCKMSQESDDQNSSESYGWDMSPLSLVCSCFL